MTDVRTRLTAELADRYRIERELGAGGMATVYLAHDLKHDRDVAIKVLHPDLAAALGPSGSSPRSAPRRELQHPHILPLLDSGEADGLLYYVMPFVEGESLRDRLDRERQLPIDDAVRIAREVATRSTTRTGKASCIATSSPRTSCSTTGQALVADFGIALAVQTRRRTADDADGPVVRDAALHESRAGDGRARRSTRAATSTRWAR